MFISLISCGYLEKQKNGKTGKPLGVSTFDAILLLVKVCFLLLISRARGKQVLTHADIQYFNNTRKAWQMAHRRRAIPYPSMRLTCDLTLAKNKRHSSEVAWVFGRA